MRLSNLTCVYAETATYYLSVAMWHGMLLSQWLYLLRPDTRTVGIAEGLPGLVKLAAAVAAAILVDACPRNPLLRVAAVLGLGVHLLVAALVAAGTSASLELWYLVLSIHAAYTVAQQVLTDAVFADSVPSGAAGRAGPYTRLYATRQAAFLVSPVLQLLYFARAGHNEWSEAALRPVMLVGVASGALSTIFFASLDQNRTLGHASEAAHVRGDAVELATTAEDDDAAPPLAAAATAAAAARRVRWLILTFDVLRVASGGLINKFIPLFFSEQGVTPFGLALLQLGIAALTVVGTLSAGALARRGLRRGSICLGLLCVCDVANLVVALSASLPVDAVAWVVRDGSLEGAFGLKKSLMMDHTPKARRGRWNAVDSLQGSVWSVATMAGGYLIAADGYRAALGAMTAGFVAATCAFVPLARTR